MDSSEEEKKEEDKREKKKTRRGQHGNHVMPNNRKRLTSGRPRGKAKKKKGVVSKHVSSSSKRISASSKKSPLLSNKRKSRTASMDVGDAAAGGGGGGGGGDSDGSNWSDESSEDGNESDGSIVVDEEVYLNQCELYYSGKDKPVDQQYTKTDRRGRRVFNAEQMRQRRMAIHYFFTQVYGSPDECTGLWTGTKGKKGILNRIRTNLMLPANTDLRPIAKTLRVIKEYESKNVVYTGQRKARKEWEYYYIKRTDFEARLIADYIEISGFGFTIVTELVNQWRRKMNRVLPNGNIDVGRSCVYQTNKRLMPKVSVIMKRQQGSLDETSQWCQASCRWGLQLCLTHRDLKQEDVPEKFYVDGEIPDCFNVDKLKMSDRRATGYFDESHKQTRGGKVLSNTKVEHRYPRDEEGDLDFENGTYATRGTEVSMKYTKEARFCYGMCYQLDANFEIVYDNKGRPLGKVLPKFEYTERKIISNPDHKKMIIATWKEARNAPDNSVFVEDPREEGVIYKGDPALLLPRIGKKAMEVLSKTGGGITTVWEYYLWFKDRPARRKNFSKNVKGLTLEAVTVAMNVASEAPDGPPAKIDHRTANNPYRARWPTDKYGEGYWMEQVLNSPIMKTVVNIREMVKHIYNVCKDNWKDTPWKDTWEFYHDALSLMLSNECVAWMKTWPTEEDSVYSHWQLPQHGLNDMFSHYKRTPSPTGNQPGGMPWDMSSNHDHDLQVLAHVAATVELDDDDPRKFSLSSPKKIADAYNRIYNNPPYERDGVVLTEECGIPAYRLGHDIHKLGSYWKKVFLNNGLNQATYIQGHRGVELTQLGKSNKKKGKHGGARLAKNAKKPEKDDHWFHPDAREAMKTFLDGRWEEYQKKLLNTEVMYGSLTQEDDVDTTDPELVTIEEREYVEKKKEEDDNQQVNLEEEDEDDVESDYEDDDILEKMEEEGDTTTTSTTDTTTTTTSTSSGGEAATKEQLTGEQSSTRSHTTTKTAASSNNGGFAADTRSSVGSKRSTRSSKRSSR